MNSILENKYPYLSNFFNQILKSPKQNIANSLVFYGSDVLAQYYFAIDLAKSLNCLNSGEIDCHCVNCNWIENNKHPAVLTISKIDSKTDESKTVISKQQIEMVRDLLVNSSSYHRVFIFCDADYKTLSTKEMESLTSFQNVKFELPKSEKEGTFWYPKGLTSSCFQDVAANALLKSIEEPPENVTFIFLTEDKSDLISTIISRSQAFYVPSFLKEKYDYEFLNDVFSSYPNFSAQDANKLSRFLLDYQVEKELDSFTIIDCIQCYLKDLLLSNKDNKAFYNRVLKDIEKLQESKKMLKSHIKESIVYEDFALSLCVLNS